MKVLNKRKFDKLINRSKKFVVKYNHKKTFLLLFFLKKSSIISSFLFFLFFFELGKLPALHAVVNYVNNLHLNI